MMVVFLCLNCFMQTNILQVHPSCCQWQDSIFLGLCVCVHSTFSIVHICLLFFYSSMGGHLGCFHILIIEINAAVSISVSISFRINILLFSAKCLGVKLMDHMVILFQFFEKTSYCFSLQWLQSFVSIPTMHKVFLFHHHNNCYLWYFR